MAATPRQLSALLVPVLITGCKASTPVQAQPQEQSKVEATAAAPLDASWPRQAVPAFMPGAPCVAPYESLSGMCVHAAFKARTPPSVLAQRLAEYAKGAASPFVGGPPPSAPYPEARQRPDVSKLPPGALVASKPRDANTARQERLHALDEMLARLQERTAQRARPAPAGAAPTPAGGPPFGMSPTVSAAMITSQSAPAGNASTPTASALEAQAAAHIQQIQALTQELPESERALLVQQLEAMGLQQSLGPEIWGQLFGATSGTLPAAGR